MNRRHAVVPVIGAGLLLLTSCSGSDSSKHPQAASVAPPVVTVHAKDFAFTMPDTITAGVTTIKLVNDGPGFHHMQLVRLDSAKTLADLVTALKKPGPPPAWATFITGPNAPTPGRESNETVDLDAGNYAVLCLVDVPDGIPHFAKGMVHALTVMPAAPGAAVAVMPTPDITVTLSDYSFAFSKPITAGTHTFEVNTAPGQPHELEIMKLAAGKTPADVFKWMAKPAGPPPFEYAIGGVAATSTGVQDRFTADFAAGNYMAACFLPDPKDGKPHFAHGMVQSFTVN